MAVNASSSSTKKVVVLNITGNLENWCLDTVLKCGYELYCVNSLLVFQSEAFDKIDFFEVFVVLKSFSFIAHILLVLILTNDILQIIC